MREITLWGSTICLECYYFLLNLIWLKWLACCVSLDNHTFKWPQTCPCNSFPTLILLRVVYKILLQAEGILTPPNDSERLLGFLCKYKNTFLIYDITCHSKSSNNTPRIPFSVGKTEKEGKNLSARASHRGKKHQRSLETLLLACVSWRALSAWLQVLEEEDRQMFWMIINLTKLFSFEF